MNRKTPLKRSSYLQPGDSKLGARVGLKKSYYKLKKKAKTEAQVQQEKGDQEKMWQVFREIYQERGPYSEISGVYLGPQPLSVWYHHIYPKHTYGWMKYLKEGIIQITWEEHANVESDMYKYEEINNRRDKLKIKYGI